ncbi:MAG: hypothetical protein HW390_2236 [Candidatus Brocadiaceae bacterium]|nr:hypothetical protein [Candidatus Brocadiaceae bacterium]
MSTRLRQLFLCYVFAGGMIFSTDKAIPASISLIVGFGVPDLMRMFPWYLLPGSGFLSYESKPFSCGRFLNLSSSFRGMITTPPLK